MADAISVPDNAPRRFGLSPRTEVLAVYALLVLATVPMLTKIFTSDFGTHLAIGREIVRTGTVPAKEFLNYPSLGMHNPNGEWGFQALLYLVYAAGGLYGVSFLCWAVVFGIYVLLHRSMTLRGADPFLAVLAIFAFSGFLRIRIQPRPEIFTYLFIALTIYLFTEYYFGRRKRLLYLFPPLILVWANMHPAYLMGFILCVAFFVDAVARAVWRKELRWNAVKTWIVPPVAAGTVGLIVCGLNPHGYDALLTPLHLISREGGRGGASSVLMSISELTPVKGTGMYVYYKAAAGFAVCSLILGAVGRRLYLLDLLLFAIAFRGAWDSARAVSMMGLFLSPGASLHLTGFLQRTREWFLPKPVPKQAAPDRMKRKRKGKAGKGRPAPAPPPEPVRHARPGGRIAAMAPIVIGLVCFGAVTLLFSFSQLQYGVGMTKHKFSFAAADFLKENPIPGRMFNFFDIGGFLDWQLYPRACTFIDGRTYNSAVFRDHQIVTGAAPGWKKVLDKYRVTYIVTKAVDSSGMILPLIPALAKDRQWSLVFADGLFLIFVRDTPGNLPYIARHGISKGILPRAIITESYHYLYLGVSPVVVYSNMANMYLTLGERQKAIEALRTVLKHRDSQYLRDMLLRIELQGSRSPLRPGARK